MKEVMRAMAKNSKKIIIGFIVAALTIFTLGLFCRFMKRS